MMWKQQDHKLGKPWTTDHKNTQKKTCRSKRVTKFTAPGPIIMIILYSAANCLTIQSEGYYLYNSRQKCGFITYKPCDIEHWLLDIGWTWEIFWSAKPLSHCCTWINTIGISSRVILQWYIFSIPVPLSLTSLKSLSMTFMPWKPDFQLQTHLEYVYIYIWTITVAQTQLCSSYRSSFQWSYTYIHTYQQALPLVSHRQLQPLERNCRANSPCRPRRAPQSHPQPSNHFSSPGATMITSCSSFGSRMLSAITFAIGAQSACERQPVLLHKRPPLSRTSTHPNCD